MSYDPNDPNHPQFHARSAPYVAADRPTPAHYADAPKVAAHQPHGGDDGKAEAAKAKKKKTLIRIGLVLLVLLVLVGINALIHAGEESTDDATFDGHAVQISTRVGGYVNTLNISDNQLVKAGDVLLEVDPRDYQIKLDRAQAALDAALAAQAAAHQNLKQTNVSAPSNLAQADAQVKSAAASWAKAQADLRRMQRLSSEARSREQLDEAVANEKTAHSNYDDAVAKLRSAETAPQTIAAAEANRDQESAQVQQAQADLAQAQKDLADTKVIAPMDGRITRRAVEKGNYIQPGQQLGYLVGTEAWIIANFKETQLTHMKPGDRVKIKVDAYPSLHLEGRVDSIMAGTGSRFSTFPAENATGNFIKIVQRVPVKIVLTTDVHNENRNEPNNDVLLGPGMSVEPTVYTK